MVNFCYNIILASRSPRRRQLFRRLGIPFKSVHSRALEEVPVCTNTPSGLVKNNAFAKANWVADRYPDADIIIGADTIVFQKNRVFGKPASVAEAKAMLKQLKKCPHWVYTGIAIINNRYNEVEKIYEKTRVFFRDIKDSDIDKYIKFTNPLDKAGGYGIQEKGDLLIKRIEGDFFNVVGLPLVALDEALKRHIK